MAIGTTITVGFNATRVQAGFRKIGSGFKKMTRGFANAGRAMLAPFIKLMAVMAPILGVGAGIMLLRNASGQAADLEMMAVAFETLLGSASAAAERIAELQNFSMRTPFEPTEVIRASKLLQTLGGDIAATGEGLEMVGDAAAVAGQPLEEVALHVGRLFGALKSGTSAGEAVGRLQELGLISGTAKLRFQELAAAQKKGEKATLSDAAAMKLLKTELSATSGAMLKLSATFSGRVSTLKGNWDALLATLGQGLNVGLGSVVDDLNELLPTLAEKFKGVGESLGKFVIAIKNAFQQGTLGSLFWQALEYAGAKFAAFMTGALASAAQGAMDILIKGMVKAGVPGMSDPSEGRTEWRMSKLGQPFRVNVAGEKRETFGDFHDEAKKKFKIKELKASMLNTFNAAGDQEQVNWLKKLNWTSDQIKEAMRDMAHNQRRTNPMFP